MYLLYSNSEPIPPLAYCTLSRTDSYIDEFCRMFQTLNLNQAGFICITRVGSFARQADLWIETETSI